MTDINGAVSQEYEYEAFGEVFGETGNVDNVFGYDGEATEKETGINIAICI